MLGSRNDVYNLLNAMDVFVLPSVFEGFVIAVIEAQTNGLPCIVSDKVPKEINIEGSVKFLSLNLNPEEWANEILKYEKYKRVDKFDLIKKSGYDVADEAKKLEQLYCNMMDKKE
jgi:glycosyltransferase involved in cell wall biosynthesis